MSSVLLGIGSDRLTDVTSWPDNKRGAMSVFITFNNSKQPHHRLHNLRS
jgi:hypothetical protein